MGSVGSISAGSMPPAGELQSLADVEQTVSNFESVDCYVLTRANPAGRCDRMWPKSGGRTRCDLCTTMLMWRSRWLSTRQRRNNLGWGYNLADRRRRLFVWRGCNIWFVFPAKDSIEETHR